MLPGGTPVSVGAAAAVPVVARIAERLSRRGGEQAEERISDAPDLLRLAAAALSAAARARSEEKVYILARLLADGLAGATPADVLQIRAAALNDIEGPHVRMLALATSERPGRTDGQTGLTRGELCAPTRYSRRSWMPSSRRCSGMD